MINALKGAFLGFVNGLVVATAITTLLSSNSHSPFPMPPIGGPIALIACMLSVPCGTALGWLAGKLRVNRIFVLELVALAAIPMCGVFAYGYAHARVVPADFVVFAGVAALPTVVGVLALERWTRPRFESARALGLRAPVA